MTAGICLSMRTPREARTKRSTMQKKYETGQQGRNQYCGVKRKHNLEFFYLGKQLLGQYPNVQSNCCLSNF